MDLKKKTLIATFSLLTACSIKPLEPYIEPASDVPTAKLRVITNGYVRGNAYTGCSADTKVLAKAGRFFGEHQPSVNYPQMLLVPQQLNMVARFAPKMPEYLGATRMAEGAYTEMAPEYLVPAGKPFLLERLKLFAGSYGSTYQTCPEATRLFVFEENKSYEADIGLVYRPAAEGNGQAICAFSVYEVVPSGKSSRPLSNVLNFEPPADSNCGRH
jgi:hypothetical protein